MDSIRSSVYMARIRPPSRSRVVCHNEDRATYGTQASQHHLWRVRQSVFHCVIALSAQRAVGPPRLACYLST